MQTIIRYVKQFVQYVRNNKAVSALEYAMLVGAIAVAGVLILSQFTTDMKTSINKIGDNIISKTKNVGKTNN